MACEIAHDYGSQLHLLRVVTDLRQRAARSGEAPILDFHEAQQQLVQQAERQLAIVATDPMLGGKPVIRAVLVGSPHEEISRYAAEQGTSLIVLGMHGHGPVRRFLLGSVAERVLRHASCAVLTVPHREVRKLETQSALAASGADSQAR